MQLALTSNISLQIQGLDVTQSEFNLWQSQFNRLPSLNLGITQGFNFGRSIDPFTNQFIDQRIRSNNFVLSGNALLFGGGQINRTIHRNRLSTQSNKYLFQQQRNQLSLLVAQAYLTVVTQRNVLKVAQAQTLISERQLDKINRQRKAGVVPSSTYYTAETQYYTNKSNEASASDSYQTALLDLKQLLNLSSTSAYVFDNPGVDISADTTTVYNINTVYQAALSTQPEVRVGEMNKEIGLANEQIARSALQPTLSLGFNAFTGYSSARTKVIVDQNINPKFISLLTGTGDTLNVPTSLFESSSRGFNTVPYPFTEQLIDNLSQSINLQLNIPIFTNMRNRLNINTATLNTKRAVLTDANTRNQLYKSVWSAVQQYENAKVKYKAIGKSLASSNRGFSEYLKRSEVGVGNQFELNTQQSLFTQAQINYEVAKLDLVFKKMVIEYYLKPWNE